MKKTFLLLFGIILSGISGFTCTTFFMSKNGQMVFGRNYDWITGNGMVCTNQKGLAKTSDKTRDGETISWVSHYGSVTFNQYGKEFPTGGMNEKGLVVEMMWLDGTKYPDADNRPSIGELQWIQYQLDNCSTVGELIETDKKLRIASIGTTPLHFLVADAKGNAATIEFFEGKMIVHQGKDMPFSVLTNDKYAFSLTQTKTAAGTAGGNSLSFISNSIDRFAKTCNMIESFQQTAAGNTPIVEYASGILDKVAQGTHTKWSIVYDITNKEIYFKSLGFPQVKHLAFSSFDFACSVPAKAWEMNQPVSGEVAKLFSNYSADLNRKIVEKSFEESSSQFIISEDGIRETWQYPGRITCYKPQN